MKKIYLLLRVSKLIRSVIIASLILLGQTKVEAQLIATYPLASGSSNPPIGTALAAGTSPNVTAGTMLYGSHMQGTSGHNSSGYRVKQDGSVDDWPTVPTEGFSFDYPISPKTGFDFKITGITANINNHNNSPNLIIRPYFQIVGTTTWQPLAAGVNVTSSVSSINFGVIDESFFNGKSYIFRFYVYGNGQADKGQDFRMRDLVFQGTTSAPPALVPIVTTTAPATAVTKYAADVAGTYSFGTGFRPTLVSGIVWGTATNPTVLLSTKTTNGTGGVINSTLTGLTPGTQYYARAYALTLVDTVYGLNVQFTTLPPSVPTLATNLPTNVLSNKATSGGNNFDYGGSPLIKKGLCWSTSINPDINSFTTNEGTAPTDFVSVMTGLTPSTTYYVRAYAINGIGVGYGDEKSFTTGGPVPVITAVPSTLNFGNVPYNSTSPVLSYALSGTFLTPTTGTLSVNAPAGYLVSTSSNTGFGATATVTYTGSTVSNKIIYVKLASTTNYGSFNNFIIHTGGGTIPINSDTTFVKANLVQDPNVLTNSGTDFWLGFGYQERMSQSSGSSSEAKMTVYVATGDQAANVVVEIPGIPSWTPRTLNIAANSVGNATGFPTATGQDSRLYYTGISKRGVHVYSTNGVPVSVWVYIAANNNSASGSMVFPTSTWNSSYTVQAYGGKSNVGGVPNSYFFVIANEDSTDVTFTPSNAIVDSSAATIFKDNHAAANIKYQQNQPYTIRLNKGEVFNAMGYVSGSGSNTALGLDLSGTKVFTNCDKKITVFGGNGRCLVSTPTTCTNPTSGSDNLIQQMVPSVAWGTKYFTVPTKHMENNLFRIYVRDVTTVVKINGVIKTGLINNLYYQHESNQPQLIEGDKPINVTQFLTSCSAGGSASSIGNNGYGDPEMIILSAAQQAINKATVYNPTFANGQPGAGYINVVIKNTGISSFKLDLATNPTQMVDTGKSSYASSSALQAAPLIPIANAFKPFTADPTYSWAKFRVSYPASHTMASDVPFNAIAYGVNNDGESYGFNAGTAINNLSSIKVAVNPYGTDTSSSSIKTCVNNPVRLQIALPYLTNNVDSIMWDSRTDTSIAPYAYIMGQLDTGTPPKAKFDGSILVDGRTFYLYSSPTTYIFKKDGIYQIKPKVYGTFISECGGVDSSNIITVIVGKDDVAFTAVAGACGSNQVTFTDASQPLAGTTIKEWRWNFGDNTNYTSTNTSNPNPIPNPHQYPASSSYWAKLEVRNSVGCTTVDSLLIDLSFNLKAKFTVSTDTICADGTVTFVDQSTPNAVKWTWNWDDGTPNTVVTGTSPTSAVTHIFTNTTTANITRKVKLFVENAAGCTSAVVDTNIVVIAKPVVNFQTPPGICLGGSMQFTNLSTPTTGVSYAWNFGDAANSTGSNPNTSTAQNPSHIYTSTGPFSVTLAVTDTRYGCSDTKTKALSSTIYQLPTAVITAPADACLKDTVQFIDASTPGTNNTITDWAWTFGDGGTSIIQNPKHPYYVTGNQTITLTVKNDKGCVSSVTPKQINIKQIPNVTFSAIPNICLNAAAIAITQASETTGIAGATPTPWAYSGTGGVSGTTFNPTTAGVGTAQVIATYTAANGCKDADTTSIIVMPLPTVNFTVSSVTCQKSAITFTNTSTPNAASIQSLTWDFNDAGSTASVSPATHTYNNAATYNVMLTVTNSNNCTAALPQQVVVHNKPFANFSLPASVCLPDGGATFTSLSTVADDANPSHSWNFGDPNDPTGSTSPNPTHHYSSTSSSGFPVMLTVTSQYSCVKDTTITLFNVFAQPFAAFTTDKPEVCLTDSFTFINQSTSTPVTWSWDFGDGTTNTVSQSPKHTYTTSNTFYVAYSYKDNKGCVSNIAKDTLTVNPNPVVNAGPTVYVLQGNSAIIKATASGSSTLDYLWTPLNPTNFLNYDTVLNPICTPLADEFYTLTVTGAGGCYAEDTMTVMMLKEPVIPNAFSPNGDGTNDTWEIGNLNTYAGAIVEVFNRYGQLVHRITGYSTGWNGKTNGKPLPVGTYYYIINPKNGHKIMSGNVTILR